MSDQNPDSVVAVGVGSAGCRIVSLLSKNPLLIDRFAYVSCDKNDFELVGAGKKVLIDCPVEQKLTPSIVRGLSITVRHTILNAVRGARVVFVVAGLGGATGTGLAPLVAEMAQKSWATVVGVAVMPFDFEKRLRFYAGVSLRRLRAATSGVIVIDNDTLMKSSREGATLKEIYQLANGEAVTVLASLLSKSSETTLPVGLNKVLGTVLQDGYSLLAVSRSGSIDKTEEALAGAIISISRVAEAKEVSHAVLFLTGDSSLSANHVGLAVKRLGSVMNEADVEYGVNYAGTSQLQVSLLASGFKSTKYDDYDPLSRVFRGKDVIDDSMEYALPQGLEALQSCD